MVHQPENGTKVFKEESPWQKVSCIQDDGREEKEKESISAESRWSRVSHSIYHTSNQEAHHDEETALWDDCWDTA